MHLSKAILGLLQGGSKATPVNSPLPDPRVASSEGSAYSVDPSQMLACHHELVQTLHGESGYDDLAFKLYVLPVLRTIAEYAQLLPATDGIHHSEPGGLFRFSLEAGFTAFRRADGAILVDGAPMEEHEKREAVLRYACFVAAAARALVKALTRVLVASDSGGAWDPYRERLAAWLGRHQSTGVKVDWWIRNGEKDTAILSAWIARDVVGENGIEFLASTGKGALATCVETIAGIGAGPTAEIAASASQAVVDRDLQQGGAPSNVIYGSQLLVVSALRQLVRGAWRPNEPGGRLWVTAEGVYLVVPQALDDVQRNVANMDGPAAYLEPQAIAKLLVQTSVLAYQDGSYTPYTLIVEEPGLPRHELQVAIVQMPYVLGVDEFRIPRSRAICRGQDSAERSEVVVSRENRDQQPAEKEGSTRKTSRDEGVRGAAPRGTKRAAPTPGPIQIQAASSASVTEPPVVQQPGPREILLEDEGDAGNEDETASDFAHQGPNTKDSPSADSDVRGHHERSAGKEPKTVQSSHQRHRAQEPEQRAANEGRQEDEKGNSKDAAIAQETKDADNGGLDSIKGRLARYEWVGDVIGRIVEEHLKGQRTIIFVREKSVCIQTPDAFEAISEDAARFQADARKNFLLVAVPNSAGDMRWNTGEVCYFRLNKRLSSIIGPLL